MAKKSSKPTAPKAPAARKPPRVANSSRGASQGAPAARPSGGKQRGFSARKTGNAYEVRTPMGVLNSRRGCSRTLPLLILPVLALLGLAIVPTLGRRRD